MLLIKVLLINLAGVFCQQVYAIQKSLGLKSFFIEYGKIFIGYGKVFIQYGEIINGIRFLEYWN